MLLCRHLTNHDRRDGQKTHKGHLTKGVNRIISKICFFIIVIVWYKD